MAFKIYLASPFFDETELKYVAAAEKVLRDRGYEVFSPREQEVRTNVEGWDRHCFNTDVNGILNSDAVVLLYHGNYSDSGTAFECGFAFANEIPVFVIHVNEEVSNLMIHQGCVANLNMNDLVWFPFEEVYYDYYHTLTTDTLICNEFYRWNGDMT